MICSSNEVEAIREAKEKRLIESFRLLRSRIEHEDNLINHRLSWLMAFTGFLFAAYGLSFVPEAASLTKFASAPEETLRLQNKIDAMRLLLQMVGAGAALMALLGICAANRAIRDCTRNHIKDYKDLEDYHYVFPIGYRATSRAGMIASTMFPCLIFTVWVSLCIFPIYDEATDVIIPSIVVLLGSMGIAFMFNEVVSSPLTIDVSDSGSGKRQD